MADYSTFSKKDDIRIALESFRKQFDLIERSTRDLVNLQIAHSCVRISILENHGQTSRVTASLPLMLNALHEEHNALKDCLAVIDAFCASFEKLDNVRFSWQQGKKYADDMSKRIEADVHYRPGQE